ncbi:hypothetical protein MRY87_12080 [bacterium]|nr:hypothetical protein [bacterium]
MSSFASPERRSPRALAADRLLWRAGSSDEGFSLDQALRDIPSYEAVRDSFDTLLHLLDSFPHELLMSDRGVALHRSIAREFFAIQGELGEGTSAPRLSNFRAFAGPLSLPKIISKALRWEELQVIGENITLGHDPYGELEQRAHERSYGGEEKTPLITDHRSVDDVVRTILVALEKRTPESWMPKSPCSMSREIEGLPPALFILSPGARHLFTDEEAQLFKTYELQISSTGYALTIKSRALQKGTARDAEKALGIIRKLSGEEPSARAEVLGRFGGTFPIIVTGETLLAEHGMVVARHDRIVVPYGKCQCTRAFLEERQGLIDSGTIRGYTLELSGRVDADFLHWAMGNERYPLGPIPDVEIIYRITLPSGLPFSVALKMARTYSQMTPNPIAEYGDEDRAVVDGFANFFSQSENRRSLSVFEGDFDPEHITSPQRFEEAHIRWKEAFLDQLVTAPEALQEVLREYSFTTYAEFEEHCLNRLREIPDEQDFLKREFLVLSEQEIEQMKGHYLPLLYRKHQEEEERVQRERADGTAERRVAEGYVGPEGGIPLRLMYQLMDCIVDIRKKESFRLKRAKKLNIPPEEVEVPDRIGRNLDKSPKLLCASELPASIAEAIRSGRIQREIQVLLFDPLLSPDDEAKEYPVKEIENLKRYLVSTNLARLCPLVRHYLDEGEGVVREHPELHHPFLPVFSKLFTALSSKVAEQKLIAEELRRSQGEAIQSTIAQANEIPCSADEKRERLQAVKADFERLISRAEARELRYSEHLLELIRCLMPSAFRHNAVKFHGIRDRLGTRIIYSIGAEGKGIYDIEYRDRGGRTRRTHSEALGAKRMYGGGGAELSVHDHTFSTPEEWLAFERDYKPPQELALSVVTLDEDCGHYQPPPIMLPWAADIILRELSEAGLDTEECRVIDCFMPGTRIEEFCGHAISSTDL